MDSNLPKRKMSAFLPCRKGSELVPLKNIKPFNGIEGGLVKIKLKQLLSCKLIDHVYLSTNDEAILELANKFNSPKLIVHKRDDFLCQSSTSTDELVSHALNLIKEGDIIWTHVTSPFINSALYENIILKFWEQSELGYDSLMTTTLLHGFLWDEKGPTNYDRTAEKWPRTQTIQALHEINSGAFISSSELYNTLGDRIGEKPYLYPLNKLQSFDIDWPEDFVIAEAILNKELVSL